MAKAKVGIIGCGNISGVYFKNSSSYGAYEIVACADLDVERAKAKAEEHGVPKGCSVEELLSDPEVELVINLTIPAAHAEIHLKALRAGKHTYGEKPLAVTREQGLEVLRTAKEKGLYVGSAPDTFLGAGIQTAIKLIRDGWIGRPTGATAFMMGRGHEHWHPSPEFYYQPGGGPMFDMGPYYLTALVAILGPISMVTGITGKAFEERTITSEPKFGSKIQVEVPTHVSGLMQFEGGAIGTIITTFDAMGGSNLPRIEIYGTEGTLLVPDPNTFGGSVQVRRLGAKEWSEVPHAFGVAENGRGIGVADMVQAIRERRPNRASGELAYHVLEAMHGFHDAHTEGKHYRMQSRCETPAPLPIGMDRSNWRL